MTETVGEFTFDQVRFHAMIGNNKLRVFLGKDTDGKYVDSQDYFGANEFDVENTVQYDDFIVINLIIPLVRKSDMFGLTNDETKTIKLFW